eukprot:gene25308-31748_t
MNQIEAQQSGAVTVTIASAGTTPQNAAAVKVLDPATRQVERGIKQAIERNDFHDLNYALQLGGNPNHQIHEKLGGHTALMAATIQCNLNLVKRLLSSQVSVTLRNREGLSAFDLLKRETKINKVDRIEITLLLQTAITKSYIAEQKQLAILRQYRIDMGDTTVDPLTGLIVSSTSKMGSEPASYVVDIYCVQMGEGEGEMEIGSTTSDGSSTQLVPVAGNNNKTSLLDVDSSKYSIIQVDGLHISSGGEAELSFEDYDSDANSDMGDDEEPDSNDERYTGNDYPDEESDEGSGGEEENEGVSDNEDEEDSEDGDSDGDGNHKTSRSTAAALRRNTSSNSKTAGRAITSSKKSTSTSKSNFRNAALPVAFTNRNAYGSVSNDGDYVGSSVKFSSGTKHARNVHSGHNSFADHVGVSSSGFRSEFIPTMGSGPDLETLLRSGEYTVTGGGAGGLHTHTHTHSHSGDHLNSMHCVDDEEEDGNGVEGEGDQSSGDEEDCYAGLSQADRAFNSVR